MNSKELLKKHLPRQKTLWHRGTQDAARGREKSPEQRRKEGMHQKEPIITKKLTLKELYRGELNPALQWSVVVPVKEPRAKALSRSPRIP